MSHDHAAGLYAMFAVSARRRPDAVAVDVDRELTRYAELDRLARRIAVTLIKRRTQAEPRLTAVLGASGVSTFAGILGALASGHGYVPIVPTLPVARIERMLKQSGATELLVDQHGEGLLDELLGRASQPLTVILLDDEATPERRARWPMHHVVGPAQFEADPGEFVAPVASSDLAYVLFTSGSTGTPKGVMVSQANVAQFLDTVVERYQLTETDRFSHVFELTFDLSVFDLFAAWKVGGRVCVPGPRDRLLPARYIERAGLTVWFSVPSMALLMKRTRVLTHDAFPKLRWSLFCGEALPTEVASAWAQAASWSTVENLYGPTELTLACTAYRFDAERDQAHGDIVPIGWPFPAMKALIVDDALREVSLGEPGELLMTGPQQALGYWQDAERTAAAFVVPPRQTERFYRTGDRVRQLAVDGPLEFLGRVDHQVKIRGYRVELGDIEAALRRVADVETAVAIGWPLTEGGVDGVVGFVDSPTVDSADILRQLAIELPRYMVPKQIVVVETFPLNQNGKVDRNALRDRLRD